MSIKKTCQNCDIPSKCCNFQPFIPNFLLGGWMASGGKRFDAQSGFWHPIGFLPSREYKTRHYANSSDYNLDCAFYEDRVCKIWRFRPAECINYYCAPEIVRTYVSSPLRTSFSVEVAVAQMALAYYGCSKQEISSAIDDLNLDRQWEGRSIDLDKLYHFAWEWSLSLGPSDLKQWEVDSI